MAECKRGLLRINCAKFAVDPGSETDYTSSAVERYTQRVYDTAIWHSRPYCLASLTGLSLYLCSSVRELGR